MRRTHPQWWLALALLAGMLLPARLHAGPYIGDFGWCWKPAKECPCGQYYFLHYWTPELCRVVEHFIPHYLDEYPPGLPVLETMDVVVSPCRTLSPMPTHAYADPASYYGRPVLPEESSKDEKK